MQAALSHAFGVLLRAPLDSFDADATYALYHWDDIRSDEFFDAEHTVDDLRRPETRQASPVADSGWDPEIFGDPDRWAFDLGRTIFEVDDWEHPVRERLLDAKLPHRKDFAVLGSDLGRVLDEEGLDLGDLSEEYTAVLLRVQTDGSLFDAMRAATWTMSAPAGLYPFRDGYEVAEAWRAELDHIDDPALRAHLAMLCLTDHYSRSDGARFDGPRCPGMLKILEKLPGHTVVAGWEFGEGQAESVIVQITT